MEVEINIEKFSDNDLDELYQMVSEAILLRRGVKMPDIENMYRQINTIISENKKPQTGEITDEDFNMWWNMFGDYLASKKSLDPIQQCRDVAHSFFKWVKWKQNTLDK